MGKSNGSVRFRGRLPSYSLRFFLFFVTLIAVWFGWLAFIASHQRTVIRIVKENGGYVRFQWQGNNNDPQPPIRTWLASKLGEELVFSIAGVYLEGEKVGDDTALRLAPHLEKLRYLNWLEFRGTKITSEGLRHINGLTALERLLVRPSVDNEFPYEPTVPIQISDAGLEPISNLKNLKLLAINYGKVTGDGFANLSKLSRVEELDFRNTDIEDGDLEHLKGLDQLKRILLWRTDVSDAGLAHICDLPRLKEIYLSNTKVTDAGLLLLTRAGNLQVLDVADTDVTDDGLVNCAKLTSLHELRLHGTGVSDACLAYLARLKNLRILDVENTNITDAGISVLESWKDLRQLKISENDGVTAAAVVRLQNALPRCRVE